MQQAGIGVLSVAVASGIYWLFRKLVRPKTDNSAQPNEEKEVRNHNSPE